MSIFPAYIVDNVEETASTSTAEPHQSQTTWLQNSSFGLQDPLLKGLSRETAGQTSSSQDGEENLITIDSTDSDSSIEAIIDSERERKRRKTPESKINDVMKCIEFHGNEEYYIDKKPARQFKTFKTLYKPACPRYRKYIKRVMGSSSVRVTRKESCKRYYRHKFDKVEDVTTMAMTEIDFTDKVRNFNRKTMEAPSDLEPWIELVSLQDRNPYRYSKLMLAEKKLDILHKALIHHSKNDRLYHLYLDIINATYPSFEVSKLIDRLLSKDPYSYTLWTAQILATQCSMARCVVPDVLKIYESCMRKMYHSTQNNADGGHSDVVMLKLFNNCALFLRQAGLYEQFFALISLALDLNVATEKFEKFELTNAHQTTLIEYEELILQSGLPMNEIWMRIEKLRQAYNFLPFPSNAQCSDPQRIVFNEDVCHYIYPLKSRENSFYLILLILHLLKIPFVYCDALAEKFSARVQHIGDSDAIEGGLAIYLMSPFVAQQHEFALSLYELTKEMAVNPTFISNSIGHELYVRFITQFLMNCANAYESNDERKRLVLLLIWCRFERLLLVLQKYAKKLTPDYLTAARSRFKKLLKQKLNRNIVNLYTEFAIFEYEAIDSTGSNLQNVKNILDNVISVEAGDGEMYCSDQCFSFITYAEILVASGDAYGALRILMCYVLKLNPAQGTGIISAAKQLVALQTITKKLDEVIDIESNVEIMVLEQYFLPDNTVCILKLKVLMQYLMGQKQEAFTHLLHLLNTFQKTCERHRFLREQIYELYFSLTERKNDHYAMAHPLKNKKLTEALAEFPRSLYFMQCCGTSNAMPWYKIRSILLGGDPSVMSVVYLIAAARYRFVDRLTQTDITADDNCKLHLRHCEIIVRNRILNMFQSLTVASETERRDSKCLSLRRNALFWRLYLCCLSDQSTAFETSKKCLLHALDECPWSKALYIDGATFVPQELPHLQDLIIEKQMRIYALPQELEILREK